MTGLVRIAWPYLRRRRRWLAVALVAMVGEVATQLAAPWPLKYVVDSVLFTHTGGRSKLRTHLGPHHVRILIIVVGASVVIAVLDASLTYVDDRVTDLVAQRSVYELRRDLFAHIQGLSMAFHHHFETQVGDLLSRLSGDIQALQDLAASGISNLVTNGIGLASLIGVMYWLNWRLATLAVTFTIPMFVLAQRTTVRMRLALRTARRQEGKVSAVLEESLAAVKLVQAYGREGFEAQRLATESLRSLEASLEAAALQARLTPMVSVISALATAAVTGAGVFLVVGRKITVGELLIFLSYLRSMQGPIRQLAKLSFSLGKAAAGVERLAEVFAMAPTVVESPRAHPVPTQIGRIAFEGVTFGYRPDRPVLRGLSLTVEQGQTVALVGTTGAGKSTLVSLLPRFYDPRSGRISFDGVDIRDFTLSSLRTRISIVLQDSLIFRATVRENIAYGRPDASEEDVLAAATAAGVAAIIEDLPDGYDTVISERGASLSGGQKQTIGIARAILKNAPIVILDEPTSSMDTFTERTVMTGLNALLAGRTAFVVAHRLATVKDADLVVMISDGLVAELGTPEMLLADESSAFHMLAQTQALV